MPFRLSISGECPVPLERRQENAAHVAALCVPEADPVSPALAVVGGGASAATQIDDLRRWPGDIWAINGTCQWLKAQGVQSTLFSVDADEDLADLADGVSDALLADHCCIAAFKRLIAQGARVRRFSVGVGGTTSACNTQKLALTLGYRGISYFGCEGSFDVNSGVTHTFKNEEPAEQIIVKAGDAYYRTNLQFYMQCENLAKLLSAFPHIFFDRSGGLLGAMIEHPDSWEVVGLSGALWDKLTPPEAPRELLKMAS